MAGHGEDARVGLRIERAHLATLLLTPYVVLVKNFLKSEEQLVLLLLQAG